MVKLEGVSLGHSGVCLVLLCFSLSFVSSHSVISSRPMVD